MFLKFHKRILCCILILCICCICFWVIIYQINGINQHEYNISKDELIRCTKELEHRYTLEEYDKLNCIIDVYYQHHPNEEIMNLYGDYNNRVKNKELFSILWDDGFINKIYPYPDYNEEIGLRFVYDDIKYPKNTARDCIHGEYGFVFLYDQYVNEKDNIDLETDYSHIIYINHIHGNLYSYAMILTDNNVYKPYE